MTDGDDRDLDLTRRGALGVGGVLAGSAAIGGMTLLTSAQNDGDGAAGHGARKYRVTVVNLTRGQPFTPPAVLVHRPAVDVFSVGSPASDALQALAENGDLQPLLDLAADADGVRDAAVGDAPLVPEEDPGRTGNPNHTTLVLSADASATHLTFVSMLIATNDGFVGLDTVPLPEAINASRSYFVMGWDAGTERNTEEFGDLVPPAQSLIIGGEPEGTGQTDANLTENASVHPHAGISGSGNLPKSVYDWREPAALVQVERVEEFQQSFSTTLTGEAEVPPVDTDASGTATFSLNDAGDALDYSVEVSGIEDVVAAHIHCGPAGANGPVGVTLFEGDFSGDGVLAEGTIEGPDDGNGCGWGSFQDVLDGLRSGNTYVNVHTQENPAGEIRGQLG